MKVDFTGLQDAWTIFAAYFGSSSIGNRISLIAIVVILGVALFQMFRHSSRRYYLLLAAFGLSIGSGYGAFVGLTKYVLPELTFVTAVNRPIIAAVAATLVSLIVVYYLSHRILDDKPRRSGQKRKKGNDSLATETGYFGNTKADSSSIDWLSDRALEQEVRKSFEDKGVFPTPMQVGNEIMARRELRDKPKTS